MLVILLSKRRVREERKRIPSDSWISGLLGGASSSFHPISAYFTILHIFEILSIYFLKGFRSFSLFHISFSISFVWMGTLQFPDLGKHCSVSDCRLIDFLPFTCDRCNQVSHLSLSLVIFSSKLIYVIIICIELLLLYLMLLEQNLSFWLTFQTSAI